MEMQQVRYFLALSNTLNFTRAAEECNVTQPSLYHRASIRTATGSTKVHDPDKRTTYWHQLGAFAAAIAGDRSHVLTGPDDSVANMRVLDAIYVAAGMQPRGT